MRLDQKHIYVWGTNMQRTVLGSSSPALQTHMRIDYGLRPSLSGRTLKGGQEIPDEELK